MGKIFFTVFSVLILALNTSAQETGIYNSVPKFENLNVELNFGQRINQFSAENALPPFAYKEIKNDVYIADASSFVPYREGEKVKSQECDLRIPTVEYVDDGSSLEPFISLIPIYRLFLKRGQRR